MSKKTKISLGIIAALAVLVIVQKNFNFSHVPSFSEWKGSADEIFLQSKDSDLHIYKKDGKWVINNQAYTANQQSVNSLEKKMKDFSLSDFVTKNPYYDRFDLSDDKAIHVTVKGAGKVLREVFIGKKSQAGDQSYVKLPGKPEVYLAGNNLADDFAKKLEDLRDKTLIEMTTDTVESVSMKGKFTLAKESAPAPAKDDKNAKDKKAPETPVAQSKWILKDKPGEIDQNKVTDFLNNFTSMQAVSYPDETSVKSVISAGPLCEITFRIQGKDKTIFVYGKEKKDKDARYVCRSSENPYPALIDTYTAEKLIKASANDFVKK